MQMLLGSGAGYVFKETVSASTQNYNLKARALAAGWDGVTPLVAEITVAGGIVIGSASTASYAFDTGSGFPAGSTLALVNNGSIVGARGAGGIGGDVSSSARNGGSGGPALRAQSLLEITNRGVIGGGGGGGGGHYLVNYDPEGTSYHVTLGGGTGAGGGTSVAAATGGGSTVQNGYTFYSGSGGGLGVGGGAGYASASWAAGSVGAGGAGGACTGGGANITWLATGTRYGTLG